MLLRFVIFAMLALGLAGFGAIAWIATRPPPPAPPVQVARAPEPPPLAPPAPPPEPARLTVLTATRALRAGTLIRPEDVAVQTVAANAIPADAIRAAPETRLALTGAMLRRSYAAGETLIAGTVLQPMDRGFLAAVLAPGTRAVSVAVDPTISAGGLIWPGDHVDIVLTQTTDNQATAPGRRVSGETVLSDLRIVAVDRALVQGAVGDSADTPGGSTGPKTVTVEVTPPQAERLAVASRLGRVSLSIRPAGPDEPAGEARPAVWAQDVSNAFGASPSSSVSVYGGSTDKKEFRF